MLNLSFTRESGLSRAQLEAENLERQLAKLAAPLGKHTGTVEGQAGKAKVHP